MKKFTKFGLLLIAALAFSVSSFAQVSASAVTTASIVTSLNITKVLDMRFGDIVVGTSGGTVTLATDGSTSTTGDVTLQASSTRSQAQFTVAGEPGYTYSITITNATVSLSNGSQTMNVSSFVTDPTPTGTLDASTGQQTLNVGGTLTVAGSQATGTYTNNADLEVTVAYN